VLGGGAGNSVTGSCAGGNAGAGRIPENVLTLDAGKVSMMVPSPAAKRFAPASLMYCWPQRRDPGQARIGSKLLQPPMWFQDYRPHITAR
jgi:hypothetical protein